MRSTQEIAVEALASALRWRLDREPAIVDGLHFAQYLMENVHEFDRLRASLADHESRAVLDWMIAFRLAVFITGSKASAGELFPSQISGVGYERLAKLALNHEAAQLESNLEIDVIENWLLDGYAIDGICDIAPGDYVIDCGAFNGNSSIVFSRKTTDAGRVTAFEPNPESAKFLHQNLATMQCKNVEVLNLALGDKSGGIRFKRDGAASRPNHSGDIEVKVVTIDDFLEPRITDRLDFIKFDIEGFELPAIKGARKAIQRFRPKMAICIYHLHDDPIEIPKLVREICPWYKFYIRHNATYDGEIVLFCSPIGRTYPAGELPASSTTRLAAED